MSGPSPSLFDDARRELTQLGGELKEMAALRWQLALIEFRTAADQVKWLAVMIGVAAIGGLTALPILVLYAAEMLDGIGLSRTGWMLALGLGLLTVAAVGGFLAVRRFRRDFVGLEETLEELREDLVWLDEWTGKRGEG